MSKRNSTVKIKDGKVVFSEEVLSYFKSIRTEENSIWIDKYFEYLSDEENLNATKYNHHHIIPCFAFKDETHRIRKETESLANKFKGNIIKLSVYNHLLAHHCLWKIYNNCYSKHAIQQMCGQKKYIGDLSENELKEIAKLQEECAKENMTEKELKEYHKEWYEKNRDKQKEYRQKHQHDYYKNNYEQISAYHKERYNKNREEILDKHKKYRENNKDSIKKQKKKHYEENREEILSRQHDYYETHKEDYLERDDKYKSQMCYDPKENNFCKYSTLSMRKRRHPEKYKDVILCKYIIQTSTPST